MIFIHRTRILAACGRLFRPGCWRARRVTAGRRRCPTWRYTGRWIAAARGRILAAPHRHGVYSIATTCWSGRTLGWGRGVRRRLGRIQRHINPKDRHPQQD